MILFIPIIVTILFAIGVAFYHSSLYKNWLIEVKKPGAKAIPSPINHNFWAIARVFVTGLSVIMIASSIHALFLEMAIKTTVLCVAVYPLVFEPIFNKKIGQSFFYVGTTAKTDIILRKIFGEKAGVASMILEILIVLLYFIHIK